MSIDLAALLLLLGPVAEEPRLEWMRAFPKALEQAQEHRRAVLIYFIEGDCGPVSRPGQVEVRSAPGRADGMIRPVIENTLDECDRMEDEVWSSGAVQSEAARFALLLPAEAVDKLERRYLVSKRPTVLFSDPWGNEILRAVGYTPLDKLLPIMKAIPADFSGLHEWGELLARESENVKALTGAAHFYQGVGLGIVSERYYERALATEALKDDVAGRRDVVVARGVNLLKLQRPEEALKHFQAELAKAPDGARSDVLLLGTVMAQLQAGKRGDAQRSYQTLLSKHPQSRATARAAEHLKAEAPKP